MRHRLKWNSALVIVLCLGYVSGPVHSQNQYWPPIKPIYIVSSSEGSAESDVVPTSSEQTFASRQGAPATSSSSSEESQSREWIGPRGKPVPLPPGFDERLEGRIDMGPRPPMVRHGDPTAFDENDAEGREPSARIFWPFSVEISKGPKGASFHGPRGPPHGWGGGHGHGWDDYIEHEKHRLKYEILKLKAKKKIALLQNKVELKKLVSILLQKGIQALEWCYTEWLSEGHGWGTPHHGGHPYDWHGGWGWEEHHGHGLTDEEILNSKQYKRYQKKKKKKIKKLKKKLKFKRILQKILQKHIAKLDEVAPY